MPYLLYMLSIIIIVVSCCPAIVLFVVQILNKKDNNNKPTPKSTSSGDSDLKRFSLNAIELAKSEIESTGSFLPFGGVLTTDNKFEMVVYHDPSKTTLDHREHATIIQNIIMQKYQDPKNLLFFMAWDGVAHLASGDIDCISVKVDNKFLDKHKIFMYTYKKENGKIEILNLNEPIVNDL